MNKKKTVNYICPKCNTEELIPQDAIDFFDALDQERKQIGPPSFLCQHCNYPYMLPKKDKI